MKLITGKTGNAHITSYDDGIFNSAIFGAGDYTLAGFTPTFKKGTQIIKYGDTAEINSSSNFEIEISGGLFILSGRKVSNEDVSGVNLTIRAGTSGYNRNDSIVVRYTNVDGIESAVFAVKEGPETSDDEDNAYASIENKTSIADGATIYEYEIAIISHIGTTAYLGHCGKILKFPFPKNNAIDLENLDRALNVKMSTNAGAYNPHNLKFIFCDSSDKESMIIEDAKNSRKIISYDDSSGLVKFNDVPTVTAHLVAVMPDDLQSYVVGVYSQPTLTENLYYGDIDLDGNHLLSIRNGTVKIGKNIKYLKVSASAYWTSVGKTKARREILLSLSNSPSFNKDKQFLRGSSEFSESGISYQTISTATKIIEVSEGDFISMGIILYDGDKVSSNSSGTFIYIEAIG